MSRTRTITLTLGSIAAGAVLATGVTGLALADDTATPSPGASSSAPGTDAPSGTMGQRGPGDGMRDGRGGPGGMHGMRGGPMGEALHGELVVKAEDGTISTVRQVQGTVTAVTSTSITVEAEDGYTATFAVNAETEVHTGLPSRDRDTADATTQAITDVSVGDVARVHGTVSGDIATAEDIHAMTAEQAATMEAERQQHMQEHADASGADAAPDLVQRHAGELAGWRVGGPRRSDLVERPLDVRRPVDVGHRRRLHEAPLDPVVEQRVQVVEVAPGIEDDDGLVVHVQRAGGPDLHQLLQRADAAGERQEGVRALVHDPLPLAHVPRHDELVRVVVGDLHRDQGVGDHPDGVTAGRPRGPADLPHHRDGAGARHQPPPALGDPRPRRPGQVQVALVDGEAGGAEDADRGHAPTLDAARPTCAPRILVVSFN